MLMKLTTDLRSVKILSSFIKCIFLHFWGLRMSMLRVRISEFYHNQNVQKYFLCIEKRVTLGLESPNLLG